MIRLLKDDQGRVIFSPQSLIKTFVDTPTGYVMPCQVIERFCNPWKLSGGLKSLLCYVPPKNDTPQSTQLTESQRRHRLACPST